MFEKVSRSLKVRFKFFFRPQTYIYMDTTVDHFTPLAMRVRGKNVQKITKIVITNTCPLNFSILGQVQLASYCKNMSEEIFSL